MSVWVWALDVHDDACESESEGGTLWARTAPGAYASISCPPGYSGEITRLTRMLRNYPEILFT